MNEVEHVDELEEQEVPLENDPDDEYHDVGELEEEEVPSENDPSETDEETDSSSSEEFTFNGEIDELRDWAIDCGIHQNNLDKLLAILRRRLLPDLPKSSKTFLNTTHANYNIREMLDHEGNAGEFVYFGIKKGLKARINEELLEDDLIELIVNMDGMPLGASGVRQFWPILIKIFSKIDIYDPFPVAIFHGNS